MAKTNIVEVQFRATYGKTYDFHNIFEDVKVGDHVVVDTVNGVGVAEVVDVKNYSHKATKHVIQRVDLEAHEKRIVAEKRREELEKVLLEREKEIAKLEKYRELAQKDDKFATLLAEYEELGK